MPDFKTIADFRKDNGEAIHKVCREFVVLCRRLELFSEASVAIADRSQLSRMTERACAAIGSEAVEAVADRGYYSGEEILACEAAGNTVYLPKPVTSGVNARGRFGKQDLSMSPRTTSTVAPPGSS